VKVSSFIAESGAPATGLTPTIKIRDLADNLLVVDGDPMTEVGDGFYQYDFAAHNPAKDYVILVDGGAVLADADRYYHAATTVPADVGRINGAVVVGTGAEDDKWRGVGV
jgi:hypothetical protein